MAAKTDALTPDDVKPQKAIFMDERSVEVYAKYEHRDAACELARLRGLSS